MDHREPKGSVEDLASSSDRDELVARVRDLTPSGSTEYLPALAELVKIDLQRQWQEGRPVALESYLEAFPELGTNDTVAADLILAEYGARCRNGAPAELARLEERFPRQAEALRQLILSERRGGAGDPFSARPPGRGRRRAATDAPVDRAGREGRRRAARALRTLPDPQATGPRGDGGGLSGRGHPARPPGGPEGPPPPHLGQDAGHEPARPGPLLSRGPGRGHPQPPEPLPGVRGRPGGGHPLPDHGLHPGPAALEVHQSRPADPAAPGGGRGAQAGAGDGGGPSQRASSTAT